MAYRAGTTCALLSAIVASLVWASAQGQPAAPSNGPRSSEPIAERPEDANIRQASTPHATSVWSCSMHPHIRQPKEGACPICSMRLVPRDASVGVRKGADHDGLPVLTSLHDMLARGLRHNPQVRAAQARVQVAQAELDGVRAQAFQDIMAFREEWRHVHQQHQAATQELRESKKLAEARPENVSSQGMLDAALERRNSVAMRIQELRIQSEFLFGKSFEQAGPIAESKSRDLIEDELLPRARRILQVRMEEYQAGEANILYLVMAHRQLMELEMRLADSAAGKIDTVEASQALLRDSRAVIEAQFKAGEASPGDVLTADLELARTELMLLELGK